jgi:hypothetical protein
MTALNEAGDAIFLEGGVAQLDRLRNVFEQLRSHPTGHENICASAGSRHWPFLS